MNEGVDIDELLKRFSTSNNIDANPYLALINQFESEGYLKKEGSRLILTREGQLKCDGIDLSFLIYNKRLVLSQIVFEDG